MAVQTRIITATIFDNDGDPLPNAQVEITLRGLGNEPGGAVSPGTQTQTTDSSGIATFELWQNNGSYSNTYYEISSWNPATGVQIHRREKFIVPDHDADVKELLAMTLAGVDPNQQLLDEIREAMSGAVEAAQTSTAQAGIATNKAGIATAQASIATTQAGIATLAAANIDGALEVAQGYVAQAQSFSNEAADAVTVSTAQAGVATAAASVAQNAQTAATQQAGVSTTQAGVATSAAGVAEGHKISAADSANTATTQAGVASGAATTATTQAGISTTQAGVATTKAGESATNKSLAEAAALLSQRWANEAFNTPVLGGLYSAFHWAKIAETIVVGATEGAVLSVNGKNGPAVSLIPADLGAATVAQGLLATTAIQPSDLSAALSSYIETESLETILDDYVTVTGLSANYYTKTQIDSALNGKATSAQGARADSALQPGSIESNAFVQEIYLLAVAGV